MATRKSKKQKETIPHSTNYEKLFGTEERAAESVRRMTECCGELECRGKWCPIYDICSYGLTKKQAVKWLKS